MPSFSEIIGVIVTFVVLSTASGHRDWVWKGIVFVRHEALKSAGQDWGCPSIFDKNACQSYDPKKVSHPKEPRKKNLENISCRRVSQVSKH